MTIGKKIRVLVVDDSALARRAIMDALSRDPEIEVVGGAEDPYVAREKILALDPDVITLDLEMPRMDGISFLKILQAHHPIPVVVISSLTQAGSAKAMEAMEAGAIDVIGKPSAGQSFSEMAKSLAYHVRGAAHSRNRGKLQKAERVNSSASVIQSAPATQIAPFSPRSVIVIGSSTGGVEALRYLLPRLPNGLPPIVVVQHIPANFSRIMAHHLDELCPFSVREAKDYRVRLGQSPPVHHCRPAVDILFRSAATHAGSHAVAALLTGMGVDGAMGLKELQSAGAETMAESEESCVVFGMPQAAIRLGAANKVLPLSKMPQAILSAIAAKSAKKI